MNVSANAETMQSLRSMFPEYMSRMEAAATAEEFYEVHGELLRHLKQRLREELANASMPEEGFKEILESNREGEALGATVIDSTMYSEVINASGDKVREKVQSLFNGLKTVGQGKPGDSNALTAARLIANRFIATGEKGTAAANKKLLEYRKLNDAEMQEAKEELKTLLENMTDEERRLVGAFPGAAPAAFAGVAASGGSPVVLVVVLIIVAVLIPLIIFMAMDASCVMLVINDIRDINNNYDKYKLTSVESYNVHGKETGYTPQILSALSIDDGGTVHIFPQGGFYTTEKRSGALYGTNYGVKFTIANTDLSVGFGLECPLNGDNKCYCAFGVSAKQAAEKVSGVTSCSAESGAFKAKIVMASKSGKTAYYIARVYR